MTHGCCSREVSVTVIVTDVGCYLREFGHDPWLLFQGSDCGHDHDRC